MEKKEIRHDFRKKREALSRLDSAWLQDRLLDSFQQLTLPTLNVVHRFFPATEKKEPDPGPLVDWLLGICPGLKVLAPRVIQDERGMENILYKKGDKLRPNQWGIPEPESGASLSSDQIDLVLIPLLAFDLQGHRVGYGKGYYDRLLSTCRQDCLKIGLSFFGPVEKISDVSPLDVPLNACITPERIYEF